MAPQSRSPSMRTEPFPLGTASTPRESQGVELVERRPTRSRTFQDEQIAHGQARLDRRGSPKPPLPLRYAQCLSPFSMASTELQLTA
jgi:hypothetical protein